VFANAILSFDTIYMDDTKHAFSSEKPSRLYLQKELPDSRIAKLHACVFWVNRLEYLGFLEDLLTKLDVFTATFSPHLVAFPPDGHRIASASVDHSICTLNSTTGKVAEGPFTGHTDRNFSVEIGQHIASASADHTIRV
jgi:WD40 repeat protein